MQTKIEGIILSKHLFKERDLICHLLLRNGKKVSVIFHGGRGGGKKKKSSVLEIGHCLKVELSPASYQKEEMLYHAKEWALVFSHKKIRFHYDVFYQLCSYTKMISKLSDTSNLSDLNAVSDQSSEGLFRVLSNAIFYLDEGVDLYNLKSQNPCKNQMAIFLIKLIIELGIFPQTKGCIICGEDLAFERVAHFSFDQGGFLCQHCAEEMDPKESWHKQIWLLMTLVSRTKYKDFMNIGTDFFFVEIGQMILEYLCYHFHLDKKEFLLP